MSWALFVPIVIWTFLSKNYSEKKNIGRYDCEILILNFEINSQLRSSLIYSCLGVKSLRY